MHFKHKKIIIYSVNAYLLIWQPRIFLTFDMVTKFLDCHLQLFKVKSWEFLNITRKLSYVFIHVNAHFYPYLTTMDEKGWVNVAPHLKPISLSRKLSAASGAK